MNIVIIGGQNTLGLGGVETYVLNLSRALLNKGHEVTLICGDEINGKKVIGGVTVFQKRVPKLSLIGIPFLYFKSIGYIIKNCRNIDVVNFQSIYMAFIVGWIARVCGCNVCYTIHSLAEDNPKYNIGLKLMLKLMSFVSVWSCGKNILTISHSRANNVKKKYGKKCIVIPCGVNPPSTLLNSEILTRFGIIPNRFYLTIGRIAPIKNLDVLINAFCIRNSEDFQLVIAGDCENSYGKYLKNLARGNRNIIFLGSVMGDDKQFLLKSCFINCLISSSEGMPIALIESMVNGKSSIVTEIPSIQEVLQKEWGYWCKVRDVDSLLNQMNYVEKNYKQVIRNGEQMAEYTLNNYSWDNIAEKYLNYLHTL